MKKFVEALKRELYEVTPAERHALDILLGLASIEAARNTARIHHFSRHEPGTTEKAAASALKFVNNFDIDLGGADETDPDAIWSAVEDHVQNAWESAAFNLGREMKLPQAEVEKMLSDFSNAISGKKTVDKAAAEKVLKQHLGEATGKCPMSGWLVEDLASVKRILDGKFEPEGSAENKQYQEFRQLWDGNAPFKVKCDCGKTVSTALRGTNWRVGRHTM